MMEEAGLILIAVAIALMLVPPIHIAIARPHGRIVAELTRYESAEGCWFKAETELPQCQTDLAIARETSRATHPNSSRPT
jgi:hypothetical protein